MDGVFMKKIAKLLCALMTIALSLQFVSILNQKRELRQNIIRLHVVANSDSAQDQQLKMYVKDAIVSYLQPEMENVTSREAAEAFITENSAAISQIAADEIAVHGFDYPVKVTLQEEAFATREYDTFSLPAGIYESLRIQIGEAEGKNWWCVAFPTLCIPATAESFASAAVSAGLDESLSNTLKNSDGYNLRFFLLESIGLLENFLNRD